MFVGGLKQDSAFYARIFMFFECLIVYFGFLVSYVVFYNELTMHLEVLAMTLVTISLFYSVYSFAGMYKAWRGVRISHEFVTALACWLFIVPSSGLIVFLTKSSEQISRLWFGTGMVIAFFSVCLFRFAIRLFLSYLRNKGKNFRSVAFVGYDKNTAYAINHLRSNKWVGLRTAAIFDDEWTSKIVGVDDTVTTGSISDLQEFIEGQRRLHTPVDQVWISINERTENGFENLLEALEDTSVDVMLVPNFLGLQLNKDAIKFVAGLPVLNMSAVTKDEVNPVLKSAFDIVFSFFVILICLPLMLLVAVLIKLDSKGPVLFKQFRYGMDGREIKIWKFRSMNVQIEGDSIEQAKRNDPRVTRVGRFLRRTSLDELPQFFNVLKGEMSVVGPRPHAVVHNEEYRLKIRGYMGRHKIKPGITGLAQIRGWRGETDTLEKMEMRVKSDIDYIHNWSLWLDFKIIFMTIVKGFDTKDVF